MTDATRQRRVLLVEDHEETRLAYRTLLQLGGWDVEEAADGEAALAAALRRPPDLVVMDISVPQLDGWEATRRLKEDPATRHVPVLLVTAHALDQDRERARLVGCDGYLVKPVAPRELLAQMERLAPGP